MNELFVNAALKEAWKDQDLFQVIDDLEGEVFRKVKTRKTFRIEIANKGYFIKRHHGVGWKEIIKNLLQLKQPVLGAQNEYAALNLLNDNNIPTMTCAAYGCKGTNPAKLESFLVTEELVNMISLEDLTKDPQKYNLTTQMRKRLISTLGWTVGAMHRLGLNHRDCYICHFLFNLDNLDKLYVIDLHRAQIREKIPYRYQIKDTAGIYFSSMDLKLNIKDVIRFVRAYSQKSFKFEMANNKKFWDDVANTAAKLYKKEFKKTAPVILELKK